MLELANTKERVIVEIINKGQLHLEDLGVPKKISVYTSSIMFRYLEEGRIPQSILNYFVAALYVAQRHPLSFPMHRKKSKFCDLYMIEEGSLDYCVNEIVRVLGFRKILDDKNYPYFLDPLDLGLKIIKNMVEKECQEELVHFFRSSILVDAQFLSEKLTTMVIFEMRVFHDELFRQIYEIIYGLVSDELKEYNNYVKMQKEVFI